MDIVSRSRRSVSELARRTFWLIPGCGDKISCHPSCALIVSRVVSIIRVEFVNGEWPHFRARAEVAATADPTKARPVQRVLMVGVVAPRTIFFDCCIPDRREPSAFLVYTVAIHVGFD